LNGVLIFDLRLDLPDRYRLVRYFAYEDGGASIQPNVVRQMIIDELGIDPGGWRDPVPPRPPTAEELRIKAEIDEMAEYYYSHPHEFEDRGHLAPVA
jgi:hypothetical protein